MITQEVHCVNLVIQGMEIFFTLTKGRILMSFSTLFLNCSESPDCTILRERALKKRKEEVSHFVPHITYI